MISINDNLPYEQQDIEVQIGIHLKCHSVGWILSFLLA